MGQDCPAASRHGRPKHVGKSRRDITIQRRRADTWPGTNLAPENAPLAEPKSTATKPRDSVRSAFGFVANGLFCNQFDKPRNRSHHLPGVIDQDATHGLGCCPHEMTSRFERLLPGQAQIRIVDLPSPLPRRDRPSFVAQCSTSGGLSHRFAGSAPALRFSRPAQRSLTLWPACLLTPLRSRIQECFSPSRYLLEPLQVLPVGATSYRAGFAPARINTPFHGTQTEARMAPLIDG